MPHPPSVPSPGPSRPESSRLESSRLESSRLEPYRLEPSRLRLRIALGVGALGVLALLLIVLTGREMERLSRAEAERVAREAVTMLAHVLQDAESDARVLTRLAAAVPGVPEGNEDCAAALEEAIRGTVGFENLVRFDGEGRILCTAWPYPLDRLPQGPRTELTLARTSASPDFHPTALIRDEEGRSIALFSRGIPSPAGGGLMLGVLLDTGEMPLVAGWPPEMKLVATDPEGRIVLRLPRIPPGAEEAGGAGARDAGAGTGREAGRGEGTGGAAPTRWAGGTPLVQETLVTTGTGIELLVEAGIAPGARLAPAGSVALRNLALLGGVLLAGFLGLLWWLRGAVVTPLEELTRALRTSQERYRDIFEKAPYPMWMHDPSTLQIVAVNQAALALYGYEEEAFLAASVLDLRPDHDRERFMAALEASGGVEGLPTLQRWTHLRRDGTPFEVELTTRTLLLEGQTLRLVMVQDLTARIEAEEARAEAEARLEEILAHARDCVWVQDAASRKLLFMSPGFEAIWGRSAEELVSGRIRFLDTVHREDRQRTREAGGAFPAEPEVEEYRIVRPDGEVRWIQDRSFPIRDAKGQVYRIAGIATDITEQRRLESQLLASQRMEAVGQLAGGVAHDFNNLLTVIRGHLELARTEEGVPEAVVEEIASADRASRRAADLVQQLLAFSRRQVLLPEVVQLGETVAEAERLLSRVLPDSVELEVSGVETDLPVRVDPGKVEQILLNLAVNARDAMPSGGTLRVSLTPRQMENGVLAVDGPVPPGRYLELAVADDGEGMDPLTARMAFEPFFTTKAPGKGSGLGLSMVHGIMTQSGGYIQLESARGEGTTFRLLFPAHEG